MTKEPFKNAKVDFTGMRFGRLTVISIVEKSKSLWNCKCDCGSEIKLYTSQFLGTTKSCGCLKREQPKWIAEKSTTHGMSKTRLYTTWAGMKERCLNPNDDCYNRYGGRGITVCDEWINSFENFRDWAYSSGYDDNSTAREQSIDRIDPNGNYCPENCRWVDFYTQQKNKENTWYINVNGEKITILDFCRAHNISTPTTVKNQVDKGYTPEEIINIYNFRHGCRDGYYNVKEAANYYSVDKSTIVAWARRGILKAEKYGKFLYIPKGQIVNTKKYKMKHE